MATDGNSKHASYVPASVNNHQEAKLFFDEYDIPYQEIAEGEEKGELLTKPIRMEDRNQILEAEKRLRRSRLGVVIDHPNVFRDRNDNAVVTFSPYNIAELPKGRPWLEMSEHSIYGNGTKTFVICCEEKTQVSEQEALEQKIQKAEEKLLLAKKQYDAAIEKLHKLLEKRDEMKKGLDGGRVTLKEWTCSWKGNAVWDAGRGYVNCNYQAKMSFRPKGTVIRGPEIRKLETQNPRFQEEDVIEALKKGLCEYLDNQFEDYCMEDDYYQPVVEDFEAQDYAREWAQERGLELTAFEGVGSDDGYEPKGRGYRRFT